MSVDQNLMGLGMAAALAVRCANGGTGPVSVAAGSGYTIGGKQAVVYVTSGTSVTLPVVGGSDLAAEIADDFTIHNGTGAGLTVVIPSGVTVNVGGANKTSLYTLATKTTLSLWVVSATQWFGITA